MGRREDNPECTLFIILSPVDAPQSGFMPMPPEILRAMGMGAISYPGEFYSEEFWNNCLPLLERLDAAEDAFNKAKESQDHSTRDLEFAESSFRCAKSMWQYLKAIKALFKANIAHCRANKLVSKACKDLAAAQQALDKFLMG